MLKFHIKLKHVVIIYIVVLLLIYRIFWKKLYSLNNRGSIYHTDIFSIENFVRINGYSTGQTYVHIPVLRSNQSIKRNKNNRVSPILQNDLRSDKYEKKRQNIRIGNTWNSTYNVETCIAAVLLVRIYRYDKPELTTYELEQWIQYLKYAGVDVIYLYDAYAKDGEQLDKWVNQLFYPSEVIYHDWHRYTPYEVSKTQISAYKHATEQYKNTCKWHLAMDMDEYPFVLYDFEKGFLKRFVSNFNKIRPECSELSFANFIFSGYPKEKQWLIERFQRRLPQRANNLDKPLYIARDLEEPRLHHNILRKGQSCDINVTTARMNHYWGARIQNWKSDTQETLSETIPDESMLPILTNLKKSPLFSNTLPVYVTNRYWNVT